MLEMVSLKTTASFRPRRYVIIAIRITRKVVSLIPLPVDALPAPINISTIVNVMLPSVIAP